MVFAYKSQNLIRVQVGIRECRLEIFKELIRFAALLFGRLKYVQVILGQLTNSTQENKVLDAYLRVFLLS